MPVVCSRTVSNASVQWIYVRWIMWFGNCLQLSPKLGLVPVKCCSFASGFFPKKYDENTHLTKTLPMLQKTVLRPNTTSNTRKRNNEARSWNHCCSGKTMRITQPECVCVCVCSLRYPACNAHAPHCHLWPAPLYNILPQRHDFRGGGGGGATKNKNVCFRFLYNFCMEHFSF